MTELMVEKHARKNIYKTCNPGEKVFIRKKEENSPKDIKYWQKPWKKYIKTIPTQQSINY